MNDSILAFGPFLLMPARRALVREGQRVRLGSRALSLLVALVQQAGRIVSNDELMKSVWPNAVVGDNNLRVHIAGLRKALGEGEQGPRYIENIPLRGYCFVAPVGLESDRQPSIQMDLPASDGAASLPSAPTLVGREEALTSLCVLIAKNRLVTVVGPGGVGKTSLALVAVSKLGEDFPEGARFVDLASVADGRSVPSALASALQVEALGKDPLAAIAGHLRARRLLILIDNCEHVVDAAAEVVNMMLRLAPGVRVVATSREPLGTDGEAIQRLAPLALPPAGSLTFLEAIAYPAIRLFVDRAAESVSAFELRTGDVRAACDICRRLDGMPLAIELAAARVDTFGVRGLSEILEDRFAVWMNGPKHALPRHQTLQAVQDWSYLSLPAHQQAMLRYISVFRAEFVTGDVSAIVPVAPSDQVVGILSDLVLKSLLVADCSTEETRYRLLETTRAYAAGALEMSGEAAAVKRLHATHFVERLRHAEGERSRPGDDTSMLQYGRRIDDVRAALEWAFGPDGDVPLGVALSAASAPLWFTVSLMGEYRQIAERALATRDGAEMNASDEMQITEAYGHALWHTQGVVPAMQQAFGRALQLAEHLGSAKFKLRAIWGLWVYCNWTGAYLESVQLAGRFGDIAEASGERRVGPAHDRMMALALHLIGDQHGSHELALRVMARPEASGRASHHRAFQFGPRVAGSVVMARELWLRGYVDQAVEQCNYGVTEAKRIGHALSVCYALAVASIPVAIWRGDLADAQVMTQELLECSTEQALIFWRASAISYRHALQRMVGATSMESVSDLDGWNVNSTSILLRETLATFDPAQVDIKVLESASSTASWCQAELKRALACRLMLPPSMGNNHSARELLTKGLEISRTQSALSWELRCATDLSLLLLSEGHKSQAMDLLGPIVQKFAEGFATKDLARAQAALTRIAGGHVGHLALAF